MSGPTKRNSGFVMIEVLIAMVVLTTGLTAAISASYNGMATIATLKTKTLAQIVASNKLTELQLAREWPKKTRSTEKTTMAGLDWNITIETTPTAAELFKDIIVQVEVKVAMADRPDSHLRTVSGFLVREGASLPAQKEDN